MTPAAGWLHAGGAQPHWCAQPAWRVLDTAFGAGEKFADSASAWLAEPQRPQLLHYVALASEAATLEAVLDARRRNPALHGLDAELQAQWFGLLPGFHRLNLHGGQILLTLCIGPAQAMLRAQQCLFDSMLLDCRLGASWDGWGLRALARCCRRGTGLTVLAATAPMAQELVQAGFDLAAVDSSAVLRGSYDPHWELKRSRAAVPAAAMAPEHCIVVGAGLAGASVAAALARRGWQVSVFDAAPGPAAGASGLPVGLCLAHVSADDSPRSRLSRAGLRLALAQARALLSEGSDWSPSGVLEHRLDGSSGLPVAWGSAGQDWVRHAPQLLTGALWSEGMAQAGLSLWHAPAAWIKPARMVAAWLGNNGVRFHGNAPVLALQRAGAHWRVLGPDRIELGRASLVVLAAAGGSIGLLRQAGADPGSGIDGTDRVPDLQPVGGQVSWGWQSGDDAALPPFPVNGAGSFLAGIPTDRGPAWFAGATYQSAVSPDSSEALGHDQNLRRLRSLLPGAADFMQREREAQRLQAWHGVRYATADRLPLVGPMAGANGNSLWLCAGMGSRGLAFAPLCAELLAAQLAGEPLPVEARLLRLLQATRGAKGLMAQDCNPPKRSS